MYVEPICGRRYVSASLQRTKKDWAREVKFLVKEDYPEAEKAVQGKDNRISIVGLDFYYEAFSP
jgi:hypothetical protein